MTTCSSDPPCKLCCKLIGVTPLDKPRYVWCQHCPGTGCNIYDTRPQPCRDFACVWLQSQETEIPLSTGLKPSVCGAIIGSTVNGKDMVIHLNDGVDWRKGELGTFIKYASLRMQVILRHRKKLTVVMRNLIIGRSEDMNIDNETQVGHYEITPLPPDQQIGAIP